MVEIIVILVVGSIIYSTIQGVRRGNVSREERKNNPTIVESAADFTSEMAKHAEAYRDQAIFELEHLSWFKRFERRVSSELELAEKLAELQESLDADPELERIFSRTGGKTNPLEGLERQAEPEWVSVGPPPAPAPVSDPDTNLMRKRIFESRINQHRGFVDRVQAKLERSPKLRRSFSESMSRSGLDALILKYFPPLDPPRVLGDPARPIPAPVLPPVPAMPVVPNISVWNTARYAAASSLTTVGRPADTLPDTAASILALAETGAACVESCEYQSNNRGKIRSCAEELKIPHLVHFTRCENLPSILRRGLLSVEHCIANGVRAIRNDEMRLDGRPDGTSLSIAFPNYRMFYKYKQLAGAADWAILILSSRILWEKKCGFFKHNAADARMRDRSQEQVATVQSLREMFDTPDMVRQKWLRPYDPTDPQAEVMVYEPIEPSLIEAIAFETKAAAEKWTHLTGGIDTVYAGQGRGLFASRAQVRKN